MLTKFFLPVLLMLWTSHIGLSAEERCHVPPLSDDSQRLLGVGVHNASVTLRNNLRRHSRRVGLRDAVPDTPQKERRLTVAPAANYSYFPLVVYTGAGCRDTDGYLCSYCCNGACCEKVIDVPGDITFNPPEVLNKTAGFDDISVTARLVVPVRIILIVREGASHRFSITEIDDQLSVVNKYFATSKFRFVAYSFERVESNAMSDSCRTDPCYSNPLTCAFFQSTLPKFVTGETSAVDVMNVVVCTQITYLGEAQFPWTSVEASPAHYVQIQYGAWLGKTPASLYGLGMTMVHEIGHYFGALHTFEREGVCDTDGDYVADTVACKTYASITDPCDTRRNSCGQGYDDLANIMNYAADRCMQYFSRGQLLRMEQATLRYRQEFVRRHLVEIECPIGGINNNLDSCVCADGSNPATLCGVYAERIPITLFLPGSQRFNGELHNPPDAPPPPVSQDPLITPGILVAFVLALMVTVSAFIGLSVLVFCWCAGDKVVPVHRRKVSVPWACLRMGGRVELNREQTPSRALRIHGPSVRDDTFSLHISTQDNISQGPAARFALPSNDDGEYSDLSAGDARMSPTKPAFHDVEDQEWDVEERWEEEHAQADTEENEEVCEEEEVGEHEEEEADWSGPDGDVEADHAVNGSVLDEESARNDENEADEEQDETPDVENGSGRAEEAEEVSEVHEEEVEAHEEEDVGEHEEEDVGEHEEEEAGEHEEEEAGEGTKASSDDEVSNNNFARAVDVNDDDADLR